MSKQDDEQVDESRELENYPTIKERTEDVEDICKPFFDVLDRHREIVINLIKEQYK